MRILHGLWIFYIKLVLPSAVLAILLAVIFMDSMKIVAGIGIAYIFLAPFFHFIIYELTSPKEYYFYYNLGLSKFILWLNTVLVSLIIGLILIFI